MNWPVLAERVNYREGKVLAALRAKTMETPHAQMLSAPDEVQFICLLLKLIEARKVIEVGVFTGYTTLAMAQALPDNGRVVACDISSEWVSLGCPFWQQAGVDHKIDFREGAASETLDALIAVEAESFDLIYIDADKQGYNGYYEQSLKLLRPGGVVLFDNLFQAGRVADFNNQNPSVVHIRTLTEKLHRDTRVAFSLLPIADGLGLALKTKSYNLREFERVADLALEDWVK